MMRLLLFTVVAMHVSTCVAADYQSCVRDAQGIDPRIRDCQDAEIGRQNDTLNTVYGSLIAKLKGRPDAANAVRHAERAWLRFKDADCDVIAAVYGDGSLDRMKYRNCIINKTKSRVSDLAALDQVPDLEEQ